MVFHKVEELIDAVAGLTRETIGDRATHFDPDALRAVIGATAFFLPIALPVFAWRSISELSPSISDYYYQTSGGVLSPRDVFVGALCAIAILMFAYNGRAKVDKQVSTVGAVGALFVALFPTTPPCGGASFTGAVHYIAAAVLFLVLAFFCFWLLPPRRRSTDGKLSEVARKQYIRTGVSYFCGIVILVSIAGIGLYKATDDFKIPWVPTVWFWEALALFAFGTSWFAASNWSTVGGPGRLEKTGASAT